MADDLHLALLRSRVRWNNWRKGNHRTRPDLSNADLSNADLSRMDLSGADLRDAVLSEANLRGSDLSGAFLRGARLGGADLTEARMRDADLSGAHLIGAYLRGADLSRSYFTGADLTHADLSSATFVDADLQNAKLDGCHVYGVSAWNVRLQGAMQTNLCITPEEEPSITVDNLEVAQFLYLMLHNSKIRAIIDTLTSKIVLLLGRFTEERKLVLDVLRDALRTHGYVPVLFDFAGPTNKDATETVTLIARMARFVVADLTDPGSVPYELAKIVPDANVPVQPLLLEGAATFAMAGNLWNAREMLPVFRYSSPEGLVAALPAGIIALAEAKVAELQRERATALLRSGLLS